MRTSDRRYHTIVYEIPLNDFDYVGMSVRGTKMIITVLVELNLINKSVLIHRV